MPNNLSEWLAAILSSGAFKTALSGGLGGLVRWIALKEAFWTGVGSVVIGAISAVYVGPLIVPLITAYLSNIIIDPVSQANFAGFVVGLTGIVVVGFVVDLIRGATKNAGKRK